MIKVMLLEFRCLVGMSRLVRLGLRPRNWLTSWEENLMREEQAREMAVKTKTYDQDLRPSDLYPSGLPPIRQQERQLRPGQALHEEVPLGRSSRRMAPGWKSVLIAICALATSLLGEHSAPEDHFHDIEDGIHTQATCQSQGQKQSDTWTGSFTFVGDRTGGGHLEHDVIGSFGTSRPRGRRCLSGLGGSRQISELDFRLQLKKDHWEVQKGYCVRHHLVPQHELFDVLKVDCPVPLTKLHPICSVEMEYDDGKFTTMEYEWGKALVTPPISSAWTGRTIFQIQSKSSFTDTSSAASRKLQHRVRQALWAYETEFKLVNQVEIKQPLSQIDVFQIHLVEKADPSIDPPTSARKPLFLV